MATYTEHYHLKKPDQLDLFDLNDFNSNTDRLDQALKEAAESGPLNLVDGAAIGSLRGIYTGTEGEGYRLGKNATAMGEGTEAAGIGAFACGRQAKATGNYSHAQGRSCKAAATGSHAEGSGCEANGLCAHAEGNGTMANGGNSHAEGVFCRANGHVSHAEGESCIAGSQNSHAEGVHTLALAGNYFTYTQENVNGNQLILPAGVDMFLLEDVTYLYFVTDTIDHMFRWTACLEIVARDEATRTLIMDRTIMCEPTRTNYCVFDTGQTAGAHAQGECCLALGNGSHTQGGYTLALGDYAHAEGFDSKANGKASHTEGSHTIAAAENQHVQGKYNSTDGAGNYAHMVGNGTSDTARSNAHTLDWQGNAWFAGDVRLGPDNVSLLEKIAWLEGEIAALKGL